MVSPQIKDYIKKSRESGYSEEQIKQSLKNAGWDDSQIEEALNMSSSPTSEDKKTLQDQKKGPKRNTLSIISFILAFLLPPIGLILGIISVVQISKSKEKGKGLAIAAIIVSVIMPIAYVVLGSAIMVVIQGISEEKQIELRTQQEYILCGTDVDVDIVSLGNNKRICYTSLNDNKGEIALQMENTGTANIISWKVSTIGNDVLTSNYEYVFSPGEVKEFKFEISGNNIESIRISPQVKTPSNSSVITCREPNLEFDYSDLTKADSCDTTSWDDNI